MAYIMSGKLSQLSHVQTKSCYFLVSNFSGQWLDKRPVWETLSKNYLDGCKYRGTGSLHFLRLVSGAWTRADTWHLISAEQETQDTGYRIPVTQEYRIPTTGEHWRKRAKLTGAAEARRRRRIGEYRIKKSRTDRTDHMTNISPPTPSLLLSCTCQGGKLIAGQLGNLQELLVAGSVI